MPFYGKLNLAYDRPQGVDWLSAVRSWVKRWIDWGGRVVVLWRSEAFYVETPSILCTEKELYAHRLASIMASILDLDGAAPVTHSLNYVTLSRPNDTTHLLSNFDYCHKEIMFEQRFTVRLSSKLFVNWYCVDIFEILTLQPEGVSVQVPFWWAKYKGVRLLFSPTPISSAYYSPLPLLTDRRSLLFRIAVSEHLVYASRSFSTSNLIGVRFVPHLFSKMLLLLSSQVYSFLYQMVSRHLCLTPSYSPSFNVASLTTGRHT